MLQRHSSQTLVFRTEFGARATVTQSGLNQTLQHVWKPATIHLSASEHVAIKHMCVSIRVCFEELQHRSAYVLMFIY